MRTKTIAILATTITLFSFIFPNKSKSYVPPGTVEIASNMFIDETEITNMNWREYMYWMERTYGKSSEQYIGTIPDSSVWTKEYKTLYFSHPAYGDYPIVGVSWKQAKAFCDWRSERVMERVTINKEMKPNKNYPTKVTYRLPSSEEWERIANAGYTEKIEKKLKTKYKGASTANFHSPSQDAANTTAPVYQYWPNKYGTYNMLGNVAEMTNEEGVAKGGSWKQLQEDVSVNKNFKYERSSNWVGFRCMCEVTF
jgi:formylglycine-generating enzyme required for sulfatase activity